MPVPREAETPTSRPVGEKSVARTDPVYAVPHVFVDGLRNGFVEAKSVGSPRVKSSMLEEHSLVLVSTIGGGCIEMDSNHPIVAVAAVDGCIARRICCCSAETTRGEKTKDVGALRFRPGRVHGSIGRFGSRTVSTTNA